MTTLHDQVKAEVQRRLALAKAATPGPWISASNTRRKDGVALVGAMANRGTGRAVAVLADIDVRQRHCDAAFIADHDPVDAIRRHEAALKVLGMYEAARAEKRQSIQAVDVGAKQYRQGLALDHVSAMGRLTALGMVVQILAASYGIPIDDQEQP